LTVLEQSGVEADLGTIVRRVYLPGREGSLQTELIAATRAEGRVPYRIDGRVAALAAELRAGRPVLVLQNLGVRWLPRWHYAVVVGIDTDADEIVLRSGTERRRVTALRTFLHTWRRSDYWGFIALRPGELPAIPEPGRYFEALAALEETGHVAAARRGWLTATRQWPDSRVARFGYANSEFMLRNWQVAEAAYRRLLDEQPEFAMARNNLALSLLRQRRFAAARREAETALRQSEAQPALQAEIRRTLADIDAASR
jgi:tetratricopeptide (TPR) repeat protein